MKHIEDSHGNEVTLSDLCYLIYQGFGQIAVEQFISAIDEPTVSWKWCVPCENVEPNQDGACLICATTT